MEQTVYLDILFIINFSMDFLCFYIASKIMSVSFSSITARVCIASAIGGIYAVAALFLPTHRFLTLIADVTVCLIMCIIAYGKKYGIIFSTLVYFSVSMALGGFMTAIFNLLNRMGFDGAVIESEDGDGLSVWLLAILAAVSGVLTLFGGRFFRRSSSIKRVELTVSYKNKSVGISALVDTGNMLREPISGKTCIVVDTRMLERILPRELSSLSLDDGLKAFSSLDRCYVKDVRLIPARSATGEKMMAALRPDRIIINTGKKKYEADALIALSKLEARCGALVPAELLK